MTYRKEIKIPRERAAEINRYLTVEPKSENNCLGEDSTITETIVFDNGVQMDVKCCGVQYRRGECNTAWCEAVLFDPAGFEVCASEVEGEFLGSWKLQDGAGNTYIGIVSVDTEE